MTLHHVPETFKKGDDKCKIGNRTDIDDFKRINDTYGHIAGDEVIVRIIDTVKGIIREDDIVARWGGEEFIIILPRTTLITATVLKNLLQR